MKAQILKLIEEKPRHYTRLIKKQSELVEWIYENSLIISDNFIEHIRSAVYQESNICPEGNIKHIHRFSEGFRCTPICQCTKNSISASVTKTKSTTTDEQKAASNHKRERTMTEKYGVAYNSQRDDMKDVWKAPKVSADVHEKLISYEWMDTEYNVKQRNLSDIADELGVHYSTVGEYCIGHGFVIRRNTGYSTEERQVAEFVKSLGFEVVLNDWDILGNTEIDVYVSAMKVGIEIDGLYWHSWHPSCPKEENVYRHLNKTKNATERGVKLIHITDYEWNNCRDVVEQLIKVTLGILPNVVDSSQTFISCDISKTDGAEYLKAGYVHVGDTEPNCFWTDGTNIVESYGKSREEMFACGYRVFWDCGQRNFVKSAGYGICELTVITNHLNDK